MTEHLTDGDFQSLFDSLFGPKEELYLLRHIASCRVCQRQFSEWSCLISSLNANLEKASAVLCDERSESMAKLEKTLMGEVVRLGAKENAASLLQMIRANPAYVCISKSASLLGEKTQKECVSFIRYLARGAVGLTKNRFLSRTPREEKPNSTIGQLKTVFWKEIRGSIKKGRILAWVRQS